MGLEAGCVELSSQAVKTSREILTSCAPEISVVADNSCEFDMNSGMNVLRDGSHHECQA